MRAINHFPVNRHRARLRVRFEGGDNFGCVMDFAVRRGESGIDHPKVAEAAVVGYPHDIKGTAIYAFVTPVAGEEGSDELRRELNQEVRKDIGALAAPEKIHFTPALPKTRSGKIMRRILRKIAEGETSNLGDTSTLADPTVVDALLAGKQ
jgi:acetyl-CoA synthetase